MVKSRDNESEPSDCLYASVAVITEERRGMGYGETKFIDLCSVEIILGSF